MVRKARAQNRVSADYSNLTFGINWATSDTTSGLCQHKSTAGAVWRLIDEHGGRSMFAETLEFFDGEHELSDRAIKDEVRYEMLERVENWDERLQATGYDVRGPSRLQTTWTAVSPPSRRGRWVRS